MHFTKPEKLFLCTLLLRNPVLVYIYLDPCGIGLNDLEIAKLNAVKKLKCLQYEYFSS